MVGSICLVGFNFCPRGFTEANGQLLAISEYSTLYSLFGTAYGGDGRTTFALPDLRGRAPIHLGQGPGLSDYRLGQKGGLEAVTITTAQMPSHNHTATLKAGSNVRSTEITDRNVLANTRQTAVYGTAPGNVRLNEASLAVANNGGGQAHENRQPYLTMRYCVALTGIYPSRN